jgi:hypothetical protein
VLSLLTWHISKIIVDSLSLIVITCVMNQSNNHRLLFDALQSAITMYLKLREEITNPFALVSLIDDDSLIVFKLSFFASNIRKEICGVLDSFLSLKNIYEKRKSHNMFFDVKPWIQKPSSNIFFCWSRERYKYCG